MAVKIYTKSVSVWDENIGRYVTDEGASEWRWYDGAIALAKKGGSPPPPPDPNVTAAAQTQMNRDTSAFNNAITHGATYTPWGQQTFAGRTDPTTGATVYDQTISLDPKQQELLDIYNANDLAFGQASQGMLGRVTDTFGQPMDTSGLPALRSDVAQQGYQSGLNTGALPGLQSNVAQQGYQSNLNTNGLPALQSDLNVQGPGLVGGIDTQGLPQLYGANDLEGARRQTQDALYNRQAAYLDPQWQQRDSAERTRLANMGVVEGSEAFNNAMDTSNRARSFDYDRARDAAIIGGGDELSRLAGISQGNRGQLFGERTTGAGFTNNARQQALSEALARTGTANQARGQGFDEAVTGGQFANQSAEAANRDALLAGQFSNQARGQGFGEALSGGEFANSAAAQANRDAMLNAQFANQARGQGLNELFSLRNQPLNEYNALRSSAQVAQPQFQNPQNSMTNPTDIAGLINQNYGQQMDIWNARQQQNNALMSGLFGLGGAALAFSDERLKTNVDQVGSLPDGTGVYDYEYKDEPGKTYTGVMAQEVEKTNPSAVFKMSNGFKAVDYSKVMSKALRELY